MPMPSDAKRLHQLGITGVINMCQEYPGPIAQYRELGIEQLHLPTVDFHPPTLKMIQQGVAFIKQQVGGGGAGYFPSKAGRARSATVAICYLIAHRQMSPEQAQQYLLDHRPHVNPRLTERSVVKEFVIALGQSHN
jgi:atypical dual specificity phosphatase